MPEGLLRSGHPGRLSTGEAPETHGRAGANSRTSGSKVTDGRQGVKSVSARRACSSHDRRASIACSASRIFFSWPAAVAC